MSYCASASSYPRYLRCYSLVYSTVSHPTYPYRSMALQLPPLPVQSTPASANLQSAVHILSNLYNNATCLISSQNYNHTRLTWHLNSLYDDALPLLLQVSASADQENIPGPWLLECSQCFSDVIDHIKNLLEETFTSYALFL